MNDFIRALRILMHHEGGYVNHPNDPGGETKYGISKRAYPDIDIASLTMSDVKRIYKRDYWDKIEGDQMEWPLNFVTFDAAVNSGVKQAIVWLQKSLGVKADAIIGPITLAAIKEADPAELAMKSLARRLKMMTHLGGWEDFGRGWARRIADNLEVV